MNVRTFDNEQSGGDDARYDARGNTFVNAVIFQTQIDDSQVARTRKYPCRRRKRTCCLRKVDTHISIIQTIYFI